MARRIDEVQLIGLAVGSFIIKSYGLRFNGNAAFALNIHIIENLFGHFARRKPTGHLNQPVGQGRFPMVNMRNDGKIADVFLCLGTHGADIALQPRIANASFARGGHP